MTTRFALGMEAFSFLVSKETFQEHSKLAPSFPTLPPAQFKKKKKKELGLIF